MNIKSVSDGLNDLSSAAINYFEKAAIACINDGIPAWALNRRGIYAYWNDLDEDLKSKSHQLQHLLLQIVPKLLPILKSSPLFNESDENDI